MSIAKALSDQPKPPSQSQPMTEKAMSKWHSSFLEASSPKSMTQTELRAPVEATSLRLSHVCSQTSQEDLIQLSDKWPAEIKI